MLKEFVEFLKQYGVIGLALAVVIGGKVNALVTALVDGIIMPVATFFIPDGNWRTAKFDIGPIHLLPGPVLGAGLDVLIVAILVFLVSKHFLREQKVARK